MNRNQIAWVIIPSPREFKFAVQNSKRMEKNGTRDGLLRRRNLHEELWVLGGTGLMEKIKVCQFRMYNTAWKTVDTKAEFTWTRVEPG